MIARCAAALACVSFAAGCAENPRAPSKDPARVALFVAADLRGSLDPCGCSENMRGGLDKAAAQLAQAKRSGAATVFVEGGDSLGGPAPPPARVPQDERKARAMAEAFRAMGLGVRALGELDDAFGADFRRSLKLPELRSGEWRVLDVAGRKLGVASGWASSQDLIAASKAARGAGAAFVLGLFHGSMEQAQVVASNPALAADFVLATHAEAAGAELNRTSRTAAVPVAQLQSRGQSLLRLDLSFGGGAERFAPLKSDQDVERDLAGLDERIKLYNAQVNEPGINPELKALKQKKLVELVERRAKLLAAPAAVGAGGNTFTARFVPLDAALPSDPAVKAIIDAADRDIGKLNLMWAKAHGSECPQASREDPGFVGDAQCLECHDEARSVFEKSKHARAYESLVQKGKQYHLDCILCHVTGYERPGGVCRIDKTRGRESVGCESCHGPGAVHANDSRPETIVRTPGEAKCVTCHDKVNSPTFDYAKYLPRVLGPGHGAPPEPSR